MGAIRWVQLRGFNPTRGQSQWNLLKDFNLVNIERYSKYQFRTIVKQLIFNKNRNEILEWAKWYKKINHDTCSKEKFERKGYLTKLNVADARLYFRIKYFLIPTFRLDYKNIHKYRAENGFVPSVLNDFKEADPLPMMLSCPVSKIVMTTHVIIAPVITNFEKTRTSVTQNKK